MCINCEAPAAPRGSAKLLARMVVVAEVDDIARPGRRFGPAFVNEADGSLDDMPQLPGALIDASQNGRGALQMVSRKHESWVHPDLLEVCDAWESPMRMTSRRWTAMVEQDFPNNPVFA